MRGCSTASLTRPTSTRLVGAQPPRHPSPMERKLTRFPSSSQATGHRLDGRALLLQKAAKAVTADLASGAAWTTVRTARGAKRR